jgi:hypothetical protein
MSFKLALVGVVLLGLGIGAGAAAYQAQSGKVASPSGGTASAPVTSSGALGSANADIGSLAAIRPTTGTVVKVGEKEFSLRSDPNSNPVTVHVNDQTAFTKQVSGAVADIKKGDRIVAQGAAGGDGTLSATSIQLVAADAGGPMSQVAGGFGQFGGNQSPAGGSGANPGAKVRQGSSSGGGDSTQGASQRFAIGQVESVDGNTIIVSALAGGTPGASSGASSGASKEGPTRVVVSDKTTITKTVSGSLQDLKENMNVMVVGPRGADSVITASNVQILSVDAVQIRRTQ